MVMTMMMIRMMVMRMMIKMMLNMMMISNVHSDPALDKWLLEMHGLLSSLLLI